MKHFSSDVYFVVTLYIFIYVCKSKGSLVAGTAKRLSSHFLARWLTFLVTAAVLQ